MIEVIDKSSCKKFVYPSTNDMHSDIYYVSWDFQLLWYSLVQKHVAYKKKKLECTKCG